MALINFQLTGVIDLIKSIVNASPKAQIRKVVNIYDALHKAVESTNISRVIVFKAHNGGGLIKPDTPLYITALYEDYKAPLESTKENYQRLMVDEEYIKLLLDICNKKKVYVNPPKLFPSILRTDYAAQGITYGQYYLLGQDRKNLYFCSIMTTKEGETFLEPGQQMEINLLINVLRNNIR